MKRFKEKNHASDSDGLACFFALATFLSDLFDDVLADRCLPAAAAALSLGLLASACTRMCP
jgi:hypothetical protein